ncbi:hypothetical protein C1645_876264 [Glomus cerebriforme]|uniref:F-box domain-containing protein n=1 Tax=Glomus cerebriforme TaxID=658196 RepID=A0A397T284_9GLOM|nr:hypothetical protein C1645_876264 [Glomus cerebriforme]
MPCQLPADCLNEIFEYLEEDKPTLYSCLLVNRFWCKISIRILWRDIWDRIAHHYEMGEVSIILGTLVACLPNESKELLFRNEIFIPTSTSNPPLFNYPAFCKVLSIDVICRLIYKYFDQNNLQNKEYLVVNEVIKMFVNQNSSLKRLTYYWTCDIDPNDISFTCLSEAKVCLTDLSELNCTSSLPAEFFYQLSQICHNLQSFTIDIEEEASNDCSVSFVTLFLNLQEIKFLFLGGTKFEGFEKLQYVTFPKLQILNISYQVPKPEYVMKFLENNGKNLKEFYIGENNGALTLSITKFCPNLKKLFILFNNDELDILKAIFNSCQYLESIFFWCGKRFLGENEVLETVAEYSPKNFCELKIYNDTVTELLPEELESFFISWESRTPKKSLNLVIVKDLYDSLEVNEENMEIIKKYKNLALNLTAEFHEEIVTFLKILRRR